MAAIRSEQEYVTRVYARLDAERDRATAVKRTGPGAGGGSVLQAHVEREVNAEEAARRLAQLSAVERALPLRLSGAGSHPGRTKRTLGRALRIRASGKGRR